MNIRRFFPMGLMGLVWCAAAALSYAPVMADESAAGETASYRQVSPDGAFVAFGNLEDGAIVPPTFSIRFEIGGMGIAPAGTQIANTGHHHLLIDVEQLPDFNLPLPNNQQFLHFGGGQTHVTLTLTEGPHSLQLLLGDYAHIPHDPPVLSERIFIEVSADAAPQSDENPERSEESSE